MMTDRQALFISRAIWALAWAIVFHGMLVG